MIASLGCAEAGPGGEGLQGREQVDAREPRPLLARLEERAGVLRLGAAAQERPAELDETQVTH